MKKQKESRVLDWSAFTDVDGYLQFAKEVTDRYFKQSDDVETFDKTLSKIRQKQNDPKLTVSVIGEFSAGKSTFINALLGGYSLLETSSVQGRVKTPVFLENADGCAIGVHYRDGHVSRRKYKDPDRLKTALKNVTADAEDAGEIEWVETFLPAEILADDIRLVDTPGVNTPDHRQEENTRQVLAEQSDLSVVLISGIQVLPDSFCTFLEQNLSDELDKCCFVLTKMDHFPQEEQERILDYTRQKLAQRFSVSDPSVFLYAARNEQDGAVPLDTAMGSSQQARDTLLHDLRRRSAWAKLRSTLRMTDHLLCAMEERMTELLSVRQTQLEEKMQDPRLNLEHYFALSEQKYQTQFEELIPNAIIGALNELHQIAWDAEQNMVAQIQACRDLRALRSYAEMQLVAEGTAQVNRMTACARKHMQILNTAYTTEMLAFHIELLNTEEPLELTDLRKQYAFADPPIVLDHASKEDEVQQALQYLTERQANAHAPSGGRRGGLSAAGMQKELQRLCAAVHSCFTSAVNCLERAYYEQIHVLQEQITEEICRYATAYNEPLEKQNSEKELACTQESAQVKQLSEDLNILRGRRFSLQSMLPN